MRKIKLFILGTLLILSFSFVSCKSKIECERKGHSWCKLSCEEVKRCTICGATEGEKLEHNWCDATCEEAKHCTICGATEGEKLEHNWCDVTCEEAKHCTICGATEGEKLEHNWCDVTCEEAKHCTTCGTIVGEALGHHWVDATCLECEKCSECGYVRNNKLAEHQIIEATYLSPSYCKVCLEEFGKRLVCYPKELEAECSLKQQFITNEEYNHIKNYLKVYGVLDDNTKVELSLDDVQVSFEGAIETVLGYQMVLDYNGVKCRLDKVVLGLLEKIPLDLNQIEVVYDKLIPGTEIFASVYVYWDSLTEYINKTGYSDISQYFVKKGLKEPNITKRYTPFASIEFLPIQYYVKDNYCICVLPSVTIKDSVQICVYQMPDNFVKFGLDKLLADNICDLFYRVEKNTSFYVGEGDDPVLELNHKTTTVSLEYFSTVEKEKLVHNIEEFYGCSYVTYERENYNETYLHFTGNDKFDIVIMITPTSGDYVDIKVSLIEK